MKRFFALMLIGMMALVSCSEDSDIDDVVVTITDVKLSTSILDFTVGDASTTLTVTTTPEDAVAKSIEWSVKDADPEGCITVDENGVVTPVSAGTATVVVTATSVDGLSVTAECKVTIANVEASSITISKESLNLKGGELETLVATVYPEAAVDTDITWSIKDVTPVGSVTLTQIGQNGKVKGITTGTATVVATLTDNSDIYAECAVSVTVDATTLVLSDEAMAFNLGDGPKTLTATIYPDDATDADVIWSVEDAAPAGCVTVDEDGVVTANAIGTAKVVATSASDITIKDFCDVTVSLAVEGVTLSAESLTFYMGGASQTLTAAVEPENAPQAVVWSVKDAAPEGCVTVEDGVVTAKAIGTATIVATSVDDDRYSAECTVEVKEVFATAITLNETALTLTVNVDSYTLTATVAPDSVSNAAVEWSVANANPEGCVTVVDGLVTPVAQGTADVVATSLSDNTVKATCAVTSNYVAPTTIALSESTLDLYIGDDATTLTYTLDPDASLLSDSTVTWSIKDGGTDGCITLVDGVVTPVSEGTATVVITSNADVENPATAECVVTVSPIAIDDLTLSASTMGIKYKETPTLAVTIEPSNATYQDVKWELTSGDCLTITEDGVITPSAVGTATVTVTSDKYPDKTASCEITVTGYEVGDYYPGDSAPAGVVFSVGDDGLSGKVFALSEHEELSKYDASNNYVYAEDDWLTWGPELCDSTDPSEGVSGTTDGLENTALLYENGGNSLDNYPIFKWIDETYNGGAGIYEIGAKGVWYMPTIQEAREWFASVYGYTIASATDLATNEVAWTAGNLATIVNNAGGSLTLSSTDEDLTDDNLRAAFNAKLTSAGGDAINFALSFVTSSENPKYTAGAKAYTVQCLALASSASSNARKGYATGVIKKPIYFRAVMAF